MSCKPDVKTTKEMYALYQKGYSLTQVGKSFGVSRQSVFKRFQRRKLELRTIEPLPFITYQGKKYTRRANGYYACTNGIREFLHRVIWENHNGKIPTNYDIHHKDGDKTNNRINNLELYSKSEHTRLFGHKGNQYSVAGAKR